MKVNSNSSVYIHRCMCVQLEIWSSEQYLILGGSNEYQEIEIGLRLQNALGEIELEKPCKIE